jgi:hypothetical protein
MNIEDRLGIQETVARFANSFDLKDWNGLEACITQSLYIDYSDLRGTPPQTVTAAEYVAARRKALDHLKLHHLVSNYEIDMIDSNAATCRASMTIWRKLEQEDFISHCFYEFQLTRQESVWKISKITQRVLWNEGTPSIHKGIQQERK